MNRVLLTALMVTGAVGCGQHTETPSEQSSNTPVTPAQPAVAKPQTEPAPPKAVAKRDANDMVLVPAGEFILGSNQEDTEGIKDQYNFAAPIFLDEHPQQKMTLPAFKIDTYEVSNIQFKEFILATDRALPNAWGHNGYGLTMKEAATMDMNRLRSIAADDFKLDMDTTTMSREQLMAEMQKEQAKKDNLPVSGVHWYYADAYCRWKGKRLPSEVEWEKAARGTEGFEFPWGNDWNAALANTGDDSDTEEGVVPVGSNPKNKSPYGVYDMAGNVWEWVADWYHPYPNSTYESDNFGEKAKIIRGGGGGVGHYALSYFFRTSTRQFAEPTMDGEDIGLRCAADG